MKKFILMLAAVVATAFSSKADIVQVNGLNYDIDKDAKTATLTFGNTVLQNTATAFSGNSYEDESVTVPATIDYLEESYPVTAIAGGAFYQSTNLKSINLPESILTIGVRAFEGCQALISIEIPANVQTIGNYAFINCSALENVTMGDEVTEIEPNTFSQCKNLKSIKLSDKITAIGENAFINCSSLTEIVLPRDLKEIGGSAFGGCSKLVKIDFNQLLETIGVSAFYNTISLKEIILPESVKRIDDSAFLSSGINEIWIPRECTLSTYRIFYGCKNLKSITLPKKLLTRFDSPAKLEETFKNCEALEVVIFDKECEIYRKYNGELLRTEVILASTFDNCYRLKNIENLPSSITTLEENAFNNCYDLENIFFEHITFVNSNSFKNCTYVKNIYFPSLNKIVLNTTSQPWATLDNSEALETLFFGANSITGSFTKAYFPPTVRKLIILFKEVPVFGYTYFAPDEVRREGTLYVPRELVDTYKTTNWWMSFRDIRPYEYMANLKLTARTRKLQVGTTMTLTPTYDNDATYPFFHWDSSNEAAATIDWEGMITGVSTGETTINARALDLSGQTANLKIKVVDYNPMDPSGNGKTNVTDATQVALEIIKSKLPGYQYDERFDINGDGNIDIYDILAIIDAILDDYQPGKANVRGTGDATANDMLVAENFNIEKNGQAVVPVRLEGLSKYAALQADVTVDGGISIDDITLGARASFSHSISTRQIDDNTVRVVLFSAMAEAFADNDEPLFNIAISGNDAKNASIMISNIIAAEDGENEAVLGYKGGMQNVVTGIDGVEDAATVYAEAGRIVVANAAGCSVAIYNVNGETVENTVAGSNLAVFPVNAGVYVVTVDGANYKVIVK